MTAESDIQNEVEAPDALDYERSNSFSYLTPSGHVFLYDAEVRAVSIVYYHEEARIIQQALNDDGTFGEVQTGFSLVQDVQINLAAEDYLSAVQTNLNAIKESSPDLLKKYGIDVQPLSDDE